jgi:Tol biopolymer transport system component
MQELYLNLGNSYRKPVAWRTCSAVGLIASFVILLLAGCAGVRSATDIDLAEADTTAGNGSIAFTGLDGNIYKSDPAGKEIAAITDNAGLSSRGLYREYRYATWSPEGHRLAFVEITTNRSEEINSQLHLWGGKARQPKVLYKSGEKIPFYIYWNPSGDSLGFLKPSDETGNQLDLVSVSTRGGKSRRLVSGKPLYWDWSPTGKNIVVHTGVAPDFESHIQTFSVLDATQKSHICETHPAYFNAPAFTGDGMSFVAAEYVRAGEIALILHSAEDCKTEEIGRIVGATSFAWSPDDLNLSYIDGEPTELGGVIGPLSMLNFKDPLNPEIFFTGAENVVTYFWSPDGKSVAYFEPKLEQNAERTVYLLQVKQLQVRTGETNLLATIVPTRSFMRQMVPFFDQYQRSATIWSPDSRNIVLNAVTQDNRPGVFVISLNNPEEPQFIAYGLLPVWSPR